MDLLSGGMSLGGLLRVWRTEVAGVTATSTAAQLGVARSAVANWESGRRRPDRERLAQLDRYFGADGALLDLAAAVATPEAFEPRTVWWHHYRPRGGPVWAWARAASAPTTLRFRARWGPFRIDLQRPCGPEGLLITLPVSVPHPPVRVDIQPVGWVDFGHGPIPKRFPVPSIGAGPYIRPAAPPDPAFDLIAHRLGDSVGLRAGWLDRLRGVLLEGASRDRPPRPPSLPPSSSGGGPGTAAIPDRQWPGERYRTLREVRGMSQREAAEEATALWPTDPVGEDQLSFFEQGGRPRVDHLAARLDVVYRADGHTLLQAVPVSREDAIARPLFPTWWHGPLWIQPSAPGDAPAGTLTIRWDPWERQVPGIPGAVLSFRKRGEDRTAPTIRLPHGWQLRAGVGAHPAATAIDYGWRAVDSAAADGIVDRYVGVYLELFGRSLDALNHLLARPPAAPPSELDSGQEP